MFENGKPPQEDWRYINGEFLKDCVFEYRTYKPMEPDNDHDHCSFCWKTFYPDKSDESVETEGYVTVSEENYVPEEHDVRRGADGSVVVPKILKTGDRVRVFSWVCRECFEDFKDIFHLKMK